MDLRLEDRVAVVLGGTSGIGRQVAIDLAKEGAKVVFQGRNEEAAAEIINLSTSGRNESMFVSADLYDYDDIDNVMTQAVNLHDRIDILFACGGTSAPKAKLFHEVTKEELEGYYRSRALHRVYAIHAAVPHMMEQKYGKIISLVTDAARMPTPAESLIGSAASSIMFLTRGLGKELARHGIRLNAIATSLTKDTGPYERFQKEVESGNESVLAKAFKKIEKHAAFGLNGPEDISDLALFLASERSDKISGATISINGGISFPQY